MFSDEIMTNIDMNSLITVDGGVISGGQLAIRGQSLQVGETNILNSRPNVFAVGSENQVLAGNSMAVGYGNRVVSPDSAVFGSDNRAGGIGYKILSAWESGNDIAISVDTSAGPVDTRCVGLKYSLENSNAATDAGSVLSVQGPVMYLSNDRHAPITYYSYYIFFYQKPDIGNDVVESGYQFVTGSDCFAGGWYSHAEGRYASAVGRYSHAEGKQTTAAWGSHAEGCANRALGECSHVEGRVNTAIGSYSTVFGCGNRVELNGWTSVAGGYLGRAKHPCTFVWNGEKKYGYRGDPTREYSYYGAGAWTLPDSKVPAGEPNRQDKQTMEYMDSDTVLSSMYESHGAGTFNVNPQGGLSGFYVGELTLAQILAERQMPLNGRTYSLGNDGLSAVLRDIIEALGGRLTP